VNGGCIECSISKTLSFSFFGNSDALDFACFDAPFPFRRSSQSSLFRATAPIRGGVSGPVHLRTEDRPGENIREKSSFTGTTCLKPVPHRADVICQLDVLRADLRIAMTTIRKMKHKQTVDADAALRKLAMIRAEAKEARDAIKPSKSA
jgi:hypothetical protein